jgi:transposase-like protein
MRRTRHTEEERKAIVERVRTSGRPVAEVAAEEGVSGQTIRSWMRAASSHRSSFIELPAPRATVVELRFADGTVLRVQG